MGSLFTRAGPTRSKTSGRILVETCASYLLASLPPAGVAPVLAALAGGAVSGWVLLPVFAAGVPTASPLRAESSESYSSSLLLDEVRK